MKSKSHAHDHDHDHDAPEGDDTIPEPGSGYPAPEPTPPPFPTVRLGERFPQVHRILTDALAEKKRQREFRPLPAPPGDLIHAEIQELTTFLKEFFPQAEEHPESLDGDLVP